MRSAEELSDRLSEERIWRVKEITTVTTLAGRHNLSLVEKEFYCRAGSTLFYAHWEGFVKRAATYYVRYISYQRIRLTEMSDFMMCLYMRQSIGISGVVSTEAQLLKLGRQLQAGHDFRPKINWKNVIQTNSNLSSVVLKKIVLQIGLNYSLYETKAFVIDNKILKHRNAIAHGEKGEIDLELLNEIGGEVIALVTLFRDMIENAVITKAHMRKMSVVSC